MVNAQTKTAKFMNDLFLEIKARCPAWPQSWPNEKIELKAREIWLESLLLNKVTKWENIKIGLSKIKSAFVPTIDEFISYCKITLDDLGLPTVEQAYKEACKNSHESKYPYFENGKRVEPKWSHEIVRLAAVDCGTHDLISKSNSFETFKKHFEFYQQKLLQGEKFEAILKALPHENTEAATTTQKVGENALKSLKTALNVKTEPVSELFIQKNTNQQKEIAYRKYLLDKLIAANVSKVEALLEIKAFAETEDYQKSLDKFIYTPTNSTKRIESCLTKHQLFKS